MLDSAADICRRHPGSAGRQRARHRGRFRVPEKLHRAATWPLPSARFSRTTIPPQIDELIRQYRIIYLARGHKLTRVYPGVPEALAALAGRKSTATTKGTPTTRAVLEQFGLIRYFDHVQGTDGFPYKPAPDVILTALAALGARPEDCLMVGDSPADMEAGKRAGVKTCAVRYGYGKPEDLARFAPDFWIDDLRALAQ